MFLADLKMLRNSVTSDHPEQVTQDEIKLDETGQPIKKIKSLVSKITNELPKHVVQDIITKLDHQIKLDELKAANGPPVKSNKPDSIPFKNAISSLHKLKKSLAVIEDNLANGIDPFKDRYPDCER